MVLASGLLGALTVVTSGVVGSPLASLVASGVALSTWRNRLRLTLVIATLGTAVLLYGDPWLQRPTTTAAAVRLAVLLLFAAMAGAAYRRGVGTRSRQTGGTSAPAPTPALDPRPIPLGHSVHPVAATEGADAITFDVTQRFVHDVRAALGADDVLLWRCAPDGAELSLFATSPAGTAVESVQTAPPVGRLVRWAADQRIVVGNYDADAPLFLAAPVMAEDRLHGVLAAYAVDRHLVGHDRTKAALTQHATQAALLLELLADGRNAQRYRARLAVLLKAAERIQNAPDIAGFGQAICQLALEASGTTRAAFVLWDESSSVGSVFTASPGHPVPEGFRISGDSLVGTACRERQRFSIREAYRMSPDYPLYSSGEPWRPVNSIGVVPLIRTRAVLGAMVVEGDREGQVTHVEGDTLGLLASVASVALENMLRLETVRERASKDSLTGLLNRGVFDEQLRQRLAESDRYGQPLSLVLIDIDHFKLVNDRYGHDAGDAVLVAIAHAIGRMVRGVDLCARYGGEELAVLLSQTGLAAARDIAERLRQTIAEQEVVVGGRSLRVTASLGVSCYPESASSHAALFSSADRALYDAKASGRNCTRSTNATGTLTDT
jgi:diguanylate cyclase (GGDEF)-like protein